MRRDNATMLWVTVLIGAFAIGVPLLAFEPANPPKYYEPVAWAFIAAGIGSVVGLVHVYLENAGRHVELRLPLPVSFPKDKPTGSEKELAPPPPRHSPRAFNPYTDIIEKIEFVNLSALWRSPRSPYIEVTLDVRQTSDYLVGLTGVDGTLVCQGADCQLPARLMNAPIDLPPHGDRFQRLVIRQPISVDMQQDFTFQPTELNLFNPGSQVLFSLAGMKWIGTAKLAEDTIRLNRTVSNDTFRVQGPVTEADAGELLWPLERIFVSQLQYGLDGKRKPVAIAGDAPGLPDEQLVLLCNSYAIPAFDALRPVLNAVFSECFAHGGWQGLSARYFRDYVYEPQYGEALSNLLEEVGKGGSPELESTFTRYSGVYLLAAAFVWQSSLNGTFADLGQIALWVKRHESLIEQVKILSGGINRRGLEIFLMLNHEYISMPTELLERATHSRGQ